MKALVEIGLLNGRELRKVDGGCIACEWEVCGSEIVSDESLPCIRGARFRDQTGQFWCGHHIDQVARADATRTFAILVIPL